MSAHIVIFKWLATMDIFFSGVCQFKAQGTSNFKNAGVGNSHLHYSPGSISLEYTGGDPCSDGTKRSTKIFFVCEPHGSERVVFIDEPDSCKYLINWYTEMACITKVRHKLTYLPCFGGLCSTVLLILWENYCGISLISTALWKVAWYWVK